MYSPFPVTDFTPIPEILDELRAGRMVVLVDDEDRENEGDLVMAAEHVTAEAVNFMRLHYQTVNTYLDYLDGAFLIRRLRPYQANIRKRLVKPLKVYIPDSGLLHALLNVPDERTLSAQPWVGASWEGFVVEQTIGALSSLGRPFETHYFRTGDGHEIDLVLDFGDERWAIEVKLTASPGPEDLARLDRSADLIGAARRFLLTRTRRPSGDERRASVDLDEFIGRLGAAR